MCWGVCRFEFQFSSFLGDNCDVTASSLRCYKKSKAQKTSLQKTWLHCWNHGLFCKCWKFDDDWMYDMRFVYIGKDEHSVRWTFRNVEIEYWGDLCHDGNGWCSSAHCKDKKSAKLLWAQVQGTLRTDIVSRSWERQITLFAHRIQHIVGPIGNDTESATLANSQGLQWMNIYDGDAWSLTTSSSRSGSTLHCILLIAAKSLKLWAFRTSWLICLSLTQRI